jgi:hypothetical protein
MRLRYAVCKIAILFAICKCSDQKANGGSKGRKQSQKGKKQIQKANPKKALGLDFGSKLVIAVPSFQKEAAA